MPQLTHDAFVQIEAFLSVSIASARRHLIETAPCLDLELAHVGNAVGL
jgi:hypothetical protein